MSDDAMKLIVEKGGGANTVLTESGFTALHSACLYGHSSLASVLLEMGAKTCPHDVTDGNTPLMMSAVGGHLDCVRLLVFSSFSLLRFSFCSHVCLI